MKKFIRAAAALLSAAFAIGLVFGFAACSNASDGAPIPLASGGSGHESGDQESGVLLSNLAGAIAALTQDSTIKMTGKVTSGDFDAIRSALSASQYKIKLDMSGVTGLDSVPQYALDGCEKLQSLTLPEGLSSVKQYAFQLCLNLESVSLPASFNSFEEFSFDAGERFSTINVADGNLVYSSVDGILFSKDKKTLVKSPSGKSGAYTVPDGVLSIGQGAFEYCQNLTSVVLPDSLQEICKNAFGWTAIESMTIPASVVTIFDHIFNGNTSLNSLTFNDTTGWHSTNNSSYFKARSGGTAASLGNATTNGNNFKNRNDYYYKDVPLGDNVETFKQNVAAMTGDATISLSGQIKQTDLAAIFDAVNKASYKVTLDMSGATGLVSVPNYAFEQCAKLQAIILPEGLLSVGGWAFLGCPILESVSIPASVTSIGNYAFSSSENFLNVNVAGGNSVYSSEGGVLFSKDKKTLIFCPKGKSGSFAIPSGVKVIGKEAFSGCANFTGITIPNTVEKIEASAFASCKISSLVIPDSVTVMEESALLNCDLLTSLKLSAKLTKIESLALSGTEMESLEIPNSVTSIADNAFQSCHSLKSLVIPASVTSLGGWMFGYCSALTSIEFKAPTGWKRVESVEDWKKKTGGVAFNFSATDFAQNATTLKETYDSNYWYKD